MKTEILYEDKDILVVYKPAGLATQTAKIGQQDVVSELKNYLRQTPARETGKSVPYLGVIHRLDQPVEGLLVFAKNKSAAASLTVQLQKQGDGGGLHKHYYAVLCGEPLKKEGELVDYLYKNQENRAIIVEPSAGQQELSKAKKAVLQYRILETGKGLEVSVLQEPESASLALADIHILTGRFHQIRAQMAHAKMPLLGDVKYASEEAKAAAQALGVRNVALCAYSLEFLHPVKKTEMSFQTEPKGKAFSFFSQT